MNSYDVSFYGLNNPVNQNHCFLNVIIQSLWHLASFRENFLMQQSSADKKAMHRHSKKELIFRKRAVEAAISKTLDSETGSQIDSGLSKRQRLESESVDKSSNLANAEQQIIQQSILESLEAMPQPKKSEKADDQEGLCLCCNLLSLFRQYEVQPKYVFDVKAETVLEPKHVRKSLEKLQSLNLQGAAAGGLGLPNDFADEAMGCAQETFMGILSYLHREYVHPNYLEDYVKADKEGRFHMDEQLDKSDCRPMCASHQTFGIETCDVIQCKQCDQITKVKEALSPDYIHNMYATEILAVQDSNPEVFKTLPLIINKTIADTNDFHMDRLNNLAKEDRTECGDCASQTSKQNKFIVQMPNVYTIGIQWLENIEIPDDPHGQFTGETQSFDIQRIFRLITSTLNLNEFYKTQNLIGTPTDKGGESINSSEYILRGIVTFYGRHYTSYFYSEKYDSWYQFDDSNIRKVGNWTDVEELCSKGRLQPILLFYEKQDIIMNFLTQGGQLEHLPGFQKIKKHIQETPSSQLNFDLDRQANLENQAFKMLMYKFFENIVEYPESFYFTEQGQMESNFWRSRSNKVSNMKALFQNQ